MVIGKSEIELCESSGTGRTAEFMATYGHGLMTARLLCVRPHKLFKQLHGLNFEVVENGEQPYLPAKKHFGLPFLISETVPKNRGGPVSFLFEATNALVSYSRRAPAHYAGVFGLDLSSFSGIKVKHSDMMKR